jgi:hypothetical protein
MANDKIEETEKTEIYTDRSAKDGKSAAGIWNEKNINLNFSFRTIGTQNSLKQRKDGRKTLHI